MTIGKKISLTCTALVGVAVLIGAVALFGMHKMSNRIDKLATDSVPGIYMSGRLQSVAKDLRGRMLIHIASDSMQDIEAAERELNTLQQEFDTLIKDYNSACFTAEDRQLYSRIAPARDAFLRSWERARQLSRALKTQEALAAFRVETLPAFAGVQKSIDDLTAYNKRSGDQAARDAIQDSSDGRTFVCAIIVIAVMGGSGLAWFIVRGLNRALRGTTAELSDGAEQVASASAQISSSSQALAQGASEQAASLEETSASTEEINSMTRKNAENAQSAAHLMDGTAQLIADANQKLDQMVTSMRDINASSDKVSKIIKVIDEIAFQTNILALNAAVEAARAGDAGMGFAVVADEVRNLAQRCAQAAKDTESLIQESIVKSAEGKTKVEQVSAAISSVTENAGKVKTLVDEINVGSQEQSRGIDQVAKAITQMEQVTQKNAASAEQGASAGEEMAAQSNALRTIVSELTALVGSSGSTEQRTRKQNAVSSKNTGSAAAGLNALQAKLRRDPTWHESAEPPVPAAANPRTPLDDAFKSF